MKKLLFLIPVLLGGTLLTGCVDDGYSRRGYGGGTVAVSYGDPYYDYGGVQYYQGDGRYYYMRDSRRIYVTTLPSGGNYWRGNNRGPSYRNDVNVNRNINVNRQNNVQVHQQNVVHQQNQQHVQKITSHGAQNPQIKGKKYKKDEDHH